MLQKKVLFLTCEDYCENEKQLVFDHMIQLNCTISLLEQTLLFEEIIPIYGEMLFECLYLNANYWYI